MAVVVKIGMVKVAEGEVFGVSEIDTVFTVNGKSFLEREYAEKWIAARNPKFVDVGEGWFLTDEFVTTRENAKELAEVAALAAWIEE